MEPIRRGRPRDPEVAQRIRRAAVDLLFEVGVEGTTVDEVARRARVAKATVYRRWASKDELIHEAFTDLLDYRVPLPDTGSVEGDLRALYTSAVAAFSTEEGARWMRTVVVECARDPQVAEVLAAGFDNRVADIQSVVDRAVARGEIRPGTTARFWAEMFSGMLLKRAIGRSSMPTPAEVEEFVQLTLRGMGVESV